MTAGHCNETAESKNGFRLYRRWATPAATPNFGRVSIGSGWYTDRADHDDVSSSDRFYRSDRRSQRGNVVTTAMMPTLCAVNEIKQLAFFSLFAIAFLTGPATGLAVSWSRGWVQKLKGVAVGCTVGALVVVVVVVVMALTHMVDTGGVVPVPGEPNRFTFPCGPPDLSGDVTLGWTMLYSVKVAAIILTTIIATTFMWTIGPTVMRPAMRLERYLRRRSGSE